MDNDRPDTATDAEWPSRTLSTRDVGGIDAAQFLPESQFAAWHDDLDRRGLRATGSAVHEAYVDALHARLRRAGVPDVRFEAVALDRWTASRWGLSVAAPDGSQPVAVGSCLPCSGATPAAGVTAPLVRLRRFGQGRQKVAGRIVLCDLRDPAVPEALTLLATHRRDPRREWRMLGAYRRPFMAQGRLVKLQERLQAAGALGMVVVSSRPRAYAPYDRTLRAIPGLYVDAATGRALDAVAKRRGSVTLTLKAVVERVPTRNIVATIPGASPEVTVLHSHTDGTNGIEDNGPDAIVAIAQYLARLPRAVLSRTVMVMLSTGHFAGGIGIEGFLAAHRSDGLLDRIGCVVTLEHLGAREWTPGSDGSLRPTGRAEPAVIFGPRNPALVRAARRVLADADIAPALILPPINPRGAGTANDAVWPGEGQYFQGMGGIPALNYIAGPTYLLDWGAGSGTRDKVDIAAVRRAAIAFTHLVLDVSCIPFSDLRKG